MGSCYDIVEEEGSHQIKMAENSDEQIELPKQYAEKQSATTLSSSSWNRGLQRDNSTKEADPSGRIFRYLEIDWSKKNHKKNCE